MSVFARLQELLGGSPIDESEKPVPQDDLNLACAALLVEVAKADYADDPREIEATIAAIREVLNISDSAIEELISEAQLEVAESASMFPHTKLINDHCTREQKYDILKAMWKVAFADGNLDKYEEHLIRRVSGLIHLDHSEFINAKIEARDSD